jgi:esterase/lipase superfamily enzyme
MISTHIRVSFLVLIAVLCGCGGADTQFMVTPRIYTHPEWNPFANVPPALQSNRVEILYVTDRAPESASGDQMQYGLKRSRSMAFGECVLQIGEDDLSWDDLVKASRTAKRDKALNLSVVSTRELARFPLTPAKLFISDEDMTHGYATDDPSGPESMQRFREELSARLAQTPRKEVFIYIHGFNNSFLESVVTAGEFWHFIGREGVPIAYTWPAGKGTLRAYGYTEQSSQYTVYHLKQLLRLIATCEDVKKVHLVGHSRGTDVVTTAVRELHLETRGVGNTKEKFKFGTLVLAAPDMDVDVVTQRIWAERISQAFDRVVMYVHKGDKALSLSNWLTGGANRLGDLDFTIFNEDEIHSMRGSERNQFVEARVSEAGEFGHDYYRANPSVSSDLILLLRYQLAPGGEHGRPLEVGKNGFWVLDDDYPKSSTDWLEVVRRRDTADMAPTTAPSDVR